MSDVNLGKVKVPVPSLSVSMYLSDPAMKNGFIGFCASLGFLAFVNKFNDVIANFKASHHISRGSSGNANGREKGKSKDKEVEVPRLFDILRFIFSRTCDFREIYTVLGLSSCLLLRTFGSVWVSRHWGKIVAAIVQRKFDQLRNLIVNFAVVTILLACLNALLKYYISLLKEHIREKITLYVHSQYMRENAMIYYKCNRVGDDKIENTDHRITSDIEKFSEIFSQVLSQSLKPVVDFVVYSVELSRVQGLTTPLTLYAWFAIASAMSTFTLPPFGILAAIEQKLEGKFIGAHSDLINNCEQIAFLSGEKPQLRLLNQAYELLYAHNQHCLKSNFKSEVFRQYLNKYFVTVIGLVLVSRPLFLKQDGFREDQLSGSGVSEYFVSTWRNMEAMSLAIQDLFELTNRIGRLSGLATRVKDLIRGVEYREPILVDEIAEASRGTYPPEFIYKDQTEVTDESAPLLELQHVSVYKPDGTLLVKDLNLKVHKGDRVLITGPNGCGKSSLFRVIKGLWPLVEGRIVVPRDCSIYFLTQVNFVPEGSLRDLVIYPHDLQDMKEHGKTDEHIKQALDWAECSPFVIKNNKAQLEFTVTTSAGLVKIRPELSDVRDWTKDLSPGQKQKIAFARLFYHKPKFVVLDECTNGISPDVEKKLYDKCTELGMSIFSISHKIELKEFHDYELHYHGDTKGHYDLLPCSETRGRYLGAGK